MRLSRRRTFSVSGIAAGIVTAGLFGAILVGPAPAKAQTAQPIWTPFEKDPSIFHNLQDAINALRSPDILMRRSGIEWMSSNAQSYKDNVSGSASAVRQQIQKHPELVPDFARALREMPQQDSLQAARLLAIIGTPAHAAVPAVCAALMDRASINQYEMLNTLVHLCGGPSKVAPTLIALMKNPEPNTRKAAAGTAGLFNGMDLNSIDPLPSGAIVLSDSQNPVENTKFRASVLPALALSLDDPVLAVRLAAAQSLESLTYNSGEAPWQETLPPLARALASPDPILRRTAARTLALVPTDTSPVAAALREALHGSDKAVVSYMITALSHAAWSNPGKTLDAFLPDLKSTNLERRRQAAADIYRAESALWGTGGQAGYESIPDEHGNSNNAYNSRQMSWSLEIENDTPPEQSVVRAGWRRTIAAAAGSRLLAALVQATSDPDHAVRTDAARSLEKIGQWTYSGLQSGSRPNPAVEARPEVITALGQAAEALRRDEPLLSSSLQELQSRVIRGPGATA